MNRTCQICLKEFPSGHALGGHMRIHGPLFAAGLVAKHRKQMINVELAAAFSTKSGSTAFEIFANEDDGATRKCKKARVGVSFMISAKECSQELAVPAEDNEEEEEVQEEQLSALNQSKSVKEDVLITYGYDDSTPSTQLSALDQYHPEREWKRIFQPRFTTHLYADLELEDSLSDVKDEQAEEDWIKICRSDGVRSTGPVRDNIKDDDNLFAVVSRRITGKRSTRFRSELCQYSQSSESRTADEEEDAASCLMLLSRGSPSCLDDGPALGSNEDREGGGDSALKQLTEPASYRIHECSTCKKRFSSHQALGGHRASHRKTRGCFAGINLHPDKEENEEDYAGNGLLWRFSDESKKQRPICISLVDKHYGEHKCSICDRIFPTGQALGGHKRCHWISMDANQKLAPASAASISNKSKHLADGGMKLEIGLIDLNLPAPEHDRSGCADEEEPTLRQREVLINDPPPLLIKA